MHDFGPDRQVRARGALLAMALALASTTTAAAGELKTFKDWMVGCDPANTCTAIGRGSEESFAGAYLVIARPAGPDGDPTVTVAITAPDVEGDPTGITLAVDGADITDTLPATAENYSIRAEIGPADLATVVDAVRTATSLSVRLDTTSGETTADVSLSGSSAALLYMDDVQGRVGTRTALARPGKASAATVPPAPALAAVAVVPIAEASADRPLPTGLPAVIEEDCSGPPPYIAFTLGAQAELWGVCTSTGAYNFFYDFYLVRGGRAVPAPLPGSEAGPITLVNPWVSDAGTLSAFFRGRGLGDCGEMVDYAYDGKRFVTVSLAVMPECRGIDQIDWPVLDRATLR